MAAPTLDEYQRQLEADPASPAFVEFAEALLAAGEARRAANVCREGLEHNPDLAAGRVLFGRALLWLGQPAEARKHFEAALASHPRDAALHASVGEALLERGLQRSAAQLFKRALALAPGDERVRALLERATRGGPGAAPAAPPATDAHGARSQPPMAAPPPEPTVADGRLAAPPPESTIADGRLSAPQAETTRPGDPLAPPPEPTIPGAPLPESTIVDGRLTAPPPEPTIADGRLSAPQAETTRPGDPLAPPPEPTVPGDLAVASRAGAATADDATAPSATPPPPPRRDAPPPRAGGTRADELLGILPLPPPEPEATVPPPEPSTVAEEAASAAAVYERELRERLAAEQARPPSWLRRHRLGISLGLLVTVGAGTGVAAYQYRRAATHEEDVAFYTAKTRNGLLRDTRAAYRASLAAIDEVLDREEDNATARALKAHVLAVLATRYGDDDADPGEAAALLGPAELAAEKELVLATRLLLADPAERKAVEDEILAVDATTAGATVHSLAGAVLLERGQLADAIERFNAALAATPGHVPTLVRVAEHYRSRKEYGEALRYDLLALAVVEDHPLAMLGAAEAQLALARDAAPLEEALAALATLPRSAVPAAQRHRHALVKARLLAGVGKRDAALEELEPLRADAAKNEDLLAALALAYVDAGAADRAVELFRADAIKAATPLPVREAWARSLLALERFRAVTLVPVKNGERSLHLLHGQAWLELGDSKKARVSLRRTATRQAGKMPVDAVVYLALADLYDGAITKARRNLERLGTGPRARTTGRYAYAQLLVREGRLADAEVALREAVAEDRTSVEARCALGRLLLRRGEPAAARAMLEETVARNPFHAEARRALGAAALAMGDLDAARPHLAAAIERMPGDARTLAQLAVLEARGGDLAEAERRLGQVAKRAARNAAVLGAKAELALLEGDAKAAAGHLLLATKNDRTDPRLWIRLGELRLQAGDARLAQAAFTAALKLDDASLPALLGQARALAADGKVKEARQLLTAQVEALADGAEAERRSALQAALTAIDPTPEGKQAGR